MRRANTIHSKQKLTGSLPSAGDQYKKITKKKKTYRKSIKILTMDIAHIRDVGQSTVPRPAISLVWRSLKERFFRGNARSQAGSIVLSMGT